ncbi:Uma2 family endonuclease [Leptothoe spongobia]|uniref:Uma2 family endonuclease n=1 Tax=Leptothoe spongobia TAU-MAC 1115 TaxID=1967444 RepID=A0A947GLZ9_9CYAN|nr:Uma2 family endonuclease [Leptothoe spongobia]MBT9315206.1 Uma2 family endonuclease [Leptothoe spongobia TAU-MAC 1115]
MVAISVKRFTTSEFHRLGELGFFDNGPVELIRGELIEMSPKRTPHSVCNTRLVRRLILLLGERATVRGQEPIMLSEHSEPSPDVVVAKYRQDDYLERHPGPDDCWAVMEISDSTLGYDRGNKLSLYAESGVRQYWIFNLVNRQLEVYREPYQDSQGNYGYRQKLTYLATENVELPMGDCVLELDGLFP